MVRIVPKVLFTFIQFILRYLHELQFLCLIHNLRNTHLSHQARADGRRTKIQNNPMKKVQLLFLFLLVIPGLSLAQSLNKSIAQSFKQFQSDPHLEFGIASLTVLNANTGEVIFAENANTGLATASTLKAITTASAYSVLGSNFQYETKLLYSGTIRNGELDGDIIILGSGDPTLGSDNFEETKPEVILQRWLTAIQSAGISRIKGSVIADDRLFKGHTAPSGWTWIDMGQYYGSGVSSINWRENKVKINISARGEVGALSTFQGTSPSLPYLRIVNEVTIGKAGSGDQVYAFSAPYSSTIYLRGSYASDLNKQIEISIPDGAYDAAFSLKSFLQKNQIPVEKEVSTAFLMANQGINLPENLTQLDRYLSPTISQISYWFMKKSINLYGEAFLKTAALKAEGDYDTRKAAEWEQKYWAAKIGQKPGALRIRDGSGLSPENRVTTMAMARILMQAKKENWFGSYYENMPVVNGLKMKSGTIGGVLGYAGYHTAPDGTPLVFAFLINNHQSSAQPMRVKMFKMLDVLK